MLRVSPSLLEQYLAAARRISSLAVGSDTDVVRLAYRISPDDSQEDHVEGLPLGTRGGLLFRHNFPQDAEYEFATFLLRNIVGYMKGLEYEHLFEVSIDGERVFAVPVGGETDNKASDTNMSEAANKIDDRLKTRVKVKAGPHMVGVTFAKRNASESDEPLQPHERDHDLQNMNGIPIIDHVNLTGPYNPTGPGDTPSRRRIYGCKPSPASAEAGMRASHPDESRHTRLSSSGDERRYGADPRALRCRAEEGRLRRGHRAGAASDSREPEVPVPHGERAGSKRQDPAYG